MNISRLFKSAALITGMFLGFRAARKRQVQALATPRPAFPPLALVMEGFHAFEQKGYLVRKVTFHPSCTKDFLAMANVDRTFPWSVFIDQRRDWMGCFYGAPVQSDNRVEPGVIHLESVTPEGIILRLVI